MEIAVGFHSLTTTTHPPNVNLPSSGQQVTARLSARKVSVAGGNRAQDPLVRDTTLSVPCGGICLNLAVGLNHNATEALKNIRWRKSLILNSRMHI